MNNLTVSREAPQDADLVTGPPERFGELFERYAASLFDFAARRVGRVLAEDLVSQTFLAAFAHRGRYDVTAPSARPWLYGILSNLLRRHHRTEARGWRALARAGMDPGPGTEPLAEAATGRVHAELAVGHLSDALAAMPRKQRELLLLHVWAGLDYPELASALGLSPGTVRSRLHRAKARLRAALPSHFAPSTADSGDLS
ncbi:RNA polymerase sigma factor [Longispora albida]|uniref:RNA polymerase sigma factor n=1 Tax=Longispora albida TaxID=203523 RepID=UPI000371D5FA|nr:sigma-70 family RNA polymerase sigma factor [Longispora albida]